MELLQLCLAHLLFMLAVVVAVHMMDQLPAHLLLRVERVVAVLVLDTMLRVEVRKVV
jgi:hypothetical protein